MRLDHPIFNTPLKAAITLEDLSVPEHYSHYAPRAVPPSLRAWKVFEQPPRPATDSKGSDSRRPLDNVGMVSDGFGFEDSPDCEWISSGINSKGPDSLALGRQANYFLWGFACSPQIMTESAKDVLTNAICWMRQFDGQHPIQKKVASPREWVIVELWVASQMNDKTPAILGSETAVATFDAKSATRYFGAATVEHASGSYPNLKRWFLDHMEAVHATKGSGDRNVHVVDEDVVALGGSNRKPEFFAQIVARLEKDPSDALAQRLLARYAPEAPSNGAAALRTWFDANRSRLYFSDFGGYRWFVNTQPSTGHGADPAPAKATSTESTTHGKHVDVRTRATTDAAKGVVTVRIDVTFDEGWHGYSPSTTAGYPMEVVIGPGRDLLAAGKLVVPAPTTTHKTAEGDEAQFSGTVTFRQDFRRRPEAVAGKQAIDVTVTAIVCDARSCLPPQELKQTLELELR